jgi:hypothetical protein
MRPAGLVALALAAAAGSACAFGAAAGRDGVAFRWEIFDVRVGYKAATVGGVSTEADKRAMSDNALAFGEKVAPLVAEAAARGATEGALAGSGAGLACEIPELVGDLLEKEGEEEPNPEEVELTPAAREIIRERREKRLEAWADAEAKERRRRATERLETEVLWAEAVEREEKRIRAALERERAEREGRPDGD